MNSTNMETLTQAEFDFREWKYSAPSIDTEREEKCRPQESQQFISLPILT